MHRVHTSTVKRVLLEAADDPVPVVKLLCQLLNVLLALQRRFLHPPHRGLQVGCRILGILQQLEDILDAAPINDHA